MGKIFQREDRNKKDWYITYYEPSGHRVKQKVGPSKKLAEAALKKIEVAIAEGKYLEVKKQHKIKFKDFASEYLELHSKVNNKTWKRSDLRNITVLNKAFSTYYLHELTPHLIEKFKAQRAKEVKPATVNRHLACLKSMFNKAIAWGRFSGNNPVKGIKLFRENNQRLRFLEKEEISRLLASCNKYIKPIVIVALNTGMRKGELLGLKWRDVDFKRDIIHLYNTKNGEKREIPINDVAKNALIGVRKHPDSELIFTKKNGESYGDFKKSFLKAMDKSGIKEFRFHDIRHTFASHLVMNGIDLNTVRELLGHICL